MCRPCALGIQPQCLLCGKKGGAMKSTRSGTKWAHVSCALWIPEVSIGCVERMEPITKISQIPVSCILSDFESNALFKLIDLFKLSLLIKSKALQIWSS